jgi:hypothetical protein
MRLQAGPIGVNSTLGGAVEDKPYDSRPYLAKKLASSNDLEQFMFEELKERLGELDKVESFVPVITRNDWWQISIPMIVITLFFIWTTL